MQLHNYLIGEGVDASILHNLKNAKHVYKHPDNFYTLLKDFDPESLDFIYSEDINENKFFKILLKEWFYSIKIGGHVIIKIKENNILNFEKLKKEINLLIGEYGKIVIENKKENIIIYKKNKPALKKEDNIDKWTFGILSNGTKIDELEKQIDSIISQKIPFFEIIICGQYKVPPKYKKFVKIIPFEYEIAWITKKKNLIAKSAKYQNLVIAHNRFVFDKDWFDGMKNYGNYFEVLMCKILTATGRRSADWMTYGVPLSNRFYNKTGLLEYQDWDQNLNINGSFYILKKTTWEKCPWNNSLVWGQYEDDCLSNDFHKKGIVPRFNPYSTIYTFPERYGSWAWKYKFNPGHLGGVKLSLSRGYFAKWINYILRKYLKIGLTSKQNYETYGWK